MIAPIVQGSQNVEPRGAAWADVSQAMPDLRPSEIAQTVVRRCLTPGERRAYDAPFEDYSSAAGLRAFPTLGPLDPDDLDAADNRAAWYALSRYRRPFATVFGAQDPLMSHWQAILRDLVPGSRFAPHVTINDAGMLVPEDAPGQLADVIVRVARQQR
jgi:haloalkane dehalogenase